MQRIVRTTWAATWQRNRFLKATWAPNFVCLQTIRVASASLHWTVECCMCLLLIVRALKHFTAKYEYRVHILVLVLVACFVGQADKRLLATGLCSSNREAFLRLRYTGHCGRRMSFLQVWFYEETCRNIQCAVYDWCSDAVRKQLWDVRSRKQTVTHPFNLHHRTGLSPADGLNKLSKVIELRNWSIESRKSEVRWGSVHKKGARTPIGVNWTSANCSHRKPERQPVPNALLNLSFVVPCGVGHTSWRCW